MTCTRCNGLMVMDVYPATQWADRDVPPYHRCVVCGNCEDNTILRHRQGGVEVRAGATPRMAGTVKR